MLVRSLDRVRRAGACAERVCKLSMFERRTNSTPAVLQYEDDTDQLKVTYLPGWKIRDGRHPSEDKDSEP